MEKKKRIVIEFTYKEAAALAEAVGNTMDYEDVLMNVFMFNNVEANAARRAYAKLKEKLNYED